MKDRLWKLTGWVFHVLFYDQNLQSKMKMKKLLVCSSVLSPLRFEICCCCGSSITGKNQLFYGYFHTMSPINLKAGTPLISTSTNGDSIILRLLSSGSFWIISRARIWSCNQQHAFVCLWWNNKMINEFHVSCVAGSILTLQTIRLSLRNNIKLFFGNLSFNVVYLSFHCTKFAVWWWWRQNLVDNKPSDRHIFLL